MGWLATPEQFLRPGRIRLVFLGVAVVAFFVTEFGRFVYRPYVYRHTIMDFGLADSIGNLGGIVVQIFLTIAAMNSTKKQSFRIATLLASGYIAYEFLQPVLPKGVFDWKDVYGTLIGLCLAFVLLLIIWKRFVDEAEEHDGPK
ncbi:hypothetical protein L6R21_21935 [bacterium]|nr:hypothetical protein [bacterium]